MFETTKSFEIEDWTYCQIESETNAKLGRPRCASPSTTSRFKLTRRSLFTRCVLASSRNLPSNPTVFIPFVPSLSWQIVVLHSHWKKRSSLNQTAHCMSLRTLYISTPRSAGRRHCPCQRSSSLTATTAAAEQGQFLLSSSSSTACGGAIATLRRWRPSSHRCGTKRLVWKRAVFTLCENNDRFCQDRLGTDAGGMIGQTQKTHRLVFCVSDAARGGPRQVRTHPPLFCSCS